MKREKSNHEIKWIYSKFCIICSYGCCYMWCNIFDWIKSFILLLLHLISSSTNKKEIDNLISFMFNFLLLLIHRHYLLCIYIFIPFATMTINDDDDVIETSLISSMLYSILKHTKRVVIDVILWFIINGIHFISFRLNCCHVSILDEFINSFQVAN